MNKFHGLIYSLPTKARRIIPNGKLYTEEGFELGLGTMHLGHFLLFQRLRYTLEKTSRAPRTDVRVVVTSSAASQYSFMGARFHESLFQEPPGDLRGEITTTRGGFQYGRAKLANVLFMRHMQKVLPDNHMCVSCWGSRYIHLGLACPNVPASCRSVHEDVYAHPRRGREDHLKMRSGPVKEHKEERRVP